MIDGSYFMPAAGIDANKKFLDARIPGAVRFDIDDVSDKTKDLPHM